ncbi:hypothetical protein MNBD_CHLOROFLEXI01-2280 [hydrothermal vent metagenome]|uniref:Uncharacterized protein n=1 Tax=hydrothermal vent metagenome TaxID=652676 RepID=A0A3B0W2B4_9ZZZZ
MRYEPWPFLPENAWTPDQAAAWWQDCFLHTDAIRDFTAVSGSAILFGEAGSGKSVALKTMLHKTAEPIFHVPYPVQNWPKGTHPWLPGRRHVSQMMAATANELIRLLNDQPDRFHNCHEMLQQFLIWLVQKHLGQRTLVRLLQQINRVTASDIPIPNKDTVEDIYPSDDHTADVRGQIDELAELVRALGYDALMITIDLNEQEASLSGQDLSDLFRLDLLENPGVMLRAVLPRRIVLQAQIENRVGGHLRLIPIYHTPEDIAQVVGRYLQAATGGAVSTLDELANTAVLNHISKEINTLYQTPTLAGWLHWAETILTNYVAQDNSTPLTNGKALTTSYYQRHVALRLVPDQLAVWRGPQLLTLDKQPFELLRKLFELKGRPAPEALLQIAGSQANLNTLIGRIRKIIEPIPKTNIYIQNKRDLGYWLENFA